VRLVGVALLDEHLQGEARGRLERAGRVELGEAAEQLAEHAVLHAVGRRSREVLDVADDEGAAARAGPAPLAEGDDPLASEGLEVLLGPEHGAPSGWSPKAALSMSSSATAEGWSL